MWTVHFSQMIDFLQTFCTASLEKAIKCRLPRLLKTQENATYAITEQKT